MAKLTMAQMENNRGSPSPTSSDTSADTGMQQFQNREWQGYRSGFTNNEERFKLKNMIPKMAFPKFEGDNPCIWKDKYLEYLSLFELPSSFWVPMASLNIEGKASKWLQVYKQKNGLGSWDTFIQAVEKKFGDNDYREALTQLLELEHTDALETHISTFDELQYQLMMHNSGLDDLFFVT